MIKIIISQNFLYSCIYLFLVKIGKILISTIGVSRISAAGCTHKYIFIFRLWVQNGRSLRRGRSPLCSHGSPTDDILRISLSWKVIS